jgi:hypothetical protein
VTRADADGFLAWRVCRGGTISWALLMLGSAWSLFAIVLGSVAPWSLEVYWQTAIAVVQLALLFGPGIHRRLGTPSPLRDV